MRTPLGRARAKSHRLAGRPPFECIALLLQGGGALGSYQAGVYEALGEADLHPDWIAGISIGAINSALIAGNAPSERVTKLRAFWQEISRASAAWACAAASRDGPSGTQPMKNKPSCSALCRASTPSFPSRGGRDVDPRDKPEDDGLFCEAYCAIAQAALASSAGRA
jgi:NTE family protein